jgi:hypothetical protein
MNPDAKTKDRNSDKSRSDKTWLIPIVVIIVIGVAVTIAIVASGGGDDEPDSVALDELSPEEIDATGEYGTVEISGTPLPPFEGEPSVGLVAPTFTTDTVDGERMTVGPAEDVRVIGFFVHSCPHCQREVSRVSGWLRTNEVPDGVEVLAVSTLAQPDRDNWPPSAWFFREGWSTPVLLDDEIGTIAAGYGMTSFPYWVVVDEDMNVITQAVGEMSDEQFAELLAVAAANEAS